MLINHAVGGFVSGSSHDMSDGSPWLCQRLEWLVWKRGRHKEAERRGGLILFLEKHFITVSVTLSYFHVEVFDCCYSLDSKKKQGHKVKHKYYRVGL